MDNPSDPAGSVKPPSESKHTVLIVFAASFGIILPAATMAIEACTGMCADTFFDPMPTLLHAVMIALVPIANLLGLIAMYSRGNVRLRNTAMILMAVSIMVSGYYSLVFLPILPFAAIGIIFMGMGLLPMSPHLSFIMTILLRRQLRIAAEKDGVPHPGVWKPMLAALLLIVLLAMPTTITTLGIQMSDSPDDATARRGLALLRSFGSNTVLLKKCYRNTASATDLNSFIFNLIDNPVPSEKVRNIYYRVTGQPFNSVKPPKVRGLRGGIISDGSDWDFDQGGDVVGGVIKGLKLDQSRMDGIVRADQSTAYVEWIMVFKNDSSVQREARSQILLPPGAVVSRLTLWIDGEEREAAYAGKSEVKEAYKRVVQRRRDPVLVTACGPDRVLMQCFPVPPDGGTMKVKVGITVPLMPYSARHAYVSCLMPCFIERNFGIKENANHNIWFEGDKKLIDEKLIRGRAFNALVGEQTTEGVWRLRGTVSNNDIQDGFAIVSECQGPAPKVCAKSSVDDSWIVQTISEESRVLPKKICIVVDGSAKMAGYSSDIAQALAAARLPMDIVSVVIAGDEPFVTPKAGTAADYAKAISEHKYAGGCDNLPALSLAWDELQGRHDSAIVWLHATQPIELSESEELMQKWERAGGPVIYDLQFGSGPNIVPGMLWQKSDYRCIYNLGGGQADISRLISGDLSQDKVLTYKRVAGTQADEQNAVKGDMHVCRLWAFDEVNRLCKSRSKSADAVKLASAYHLVTPVSGAVVLENKQQYKEAGLEPIDPSQAPNVVPEGDTLICMAIGLVLIFVYRRVRYPEVIS